MIAWMMMATLFGVLGMVGVTVVGLVGLIVMGAVAAASHLPIIPSR